ncbi:MAG: HU family DNA-binding protein [Parabacteroides sp.]
MAINIEWQVKPPVKGKNVGKPQMFPRITDSEVVDEQQLAELVASEGALSRGNAKAAFNDLADVMATLLKEGKTIDIPMIGTFKLSIGTDSQIHPESNRRMQSVVVRGVNFQPSPQFMEAIGNPYFIWQPTTGVAVAPPASQFIPVLTDYFQTHHSITRATFAQMFGLKRSTACNRLKELEQMGVIQSVGSGKETKYVRR